MIAVLCARRDSFYKALPGLDVFDADRDARTFKGGGPVIAHPPCRLWARLKGFAKSENPEAEMQLGVWCVEQVQRFGGVLEHPEHSSLFAACNLPRPAARGGARLGWTLAIPQGWFGHRGQKWTWLYIVGIAPRDLPEIPFRLAGPDTVRVELMGKAEREKTPEIFARWLVELASRIKYGRA